MNALTKPTNTLPATSWWQDPKMVSLVRRTAFKDCNADEFDEAVAVARELNLSPLRKQLYAFVFSKNDPKKRNMVLVTGIDGSRSIAARTCNYRPDDHPPVWVFKEELKDPLSNPHGIETCTVGVYHRPTANDPFQRIVHTVYWDEFAPLIRAGDDDDYDMVETGETWPDGNPKKRKKLKAGAKVTARLDPKKDAWIKSGRNQIAKCSEMGALRKGWPEDLSRLYVQEETDRSAVLEDVEYQDLTPSEMVTKAETENRLARLGPPGLMVYFHDTTAQEKIPFGKFADTVIAWLSGKTPEQIKLFEDQNRATLQEFWGHSKNDALALKAEIEKARGAKHTPAKPAAAKEPEQPKEQATEKAASASKKDALISSMEKIESKLGALRWAKDNDEAIQALSEAERTEVRLAYTAKQSAVPAYPA
jgi:phage recombination protein Bet